MRYGVLTLLCLATVIAYVHRSAISIPSKRIEAELGLGPEGMGLEMGTWYWAYAVCQLPAGWLADRWGGRRALLLFAVLWSALTGMVGLAAGLPGLLLIWGLMGAAQAGLFPCATKAIGALFPATERAFASGMLACCMSLGWAVAPLVTAWYLTFVSWQTTFALYALPGLAWAVGFALLVPPFREPAPDRSAGRTDWTKLATSVPMVLLCSQQFVRAGATAFFFTWFPRYLREVYHLSELDAGKCALWPGIGGIFGGLVGGTLSDWLLKRTGSTRLSRQGVAMLGVGAGAGCVFAARFAGDVTLAVALLTAGAFFGYVAGVSAYAVAIAMGGKR